MSVPDFLKNVPVPGKIPGQCPECGSTDVTIGGPYRATMATGRALKTDKYGNALVRAPRLGDPGTMNAPTESECHACGTKFWTKPTGG